MIVCTGQRARVSTRNVDSVIDRAILITMSVGGKGAVCATTRTIAANRTGCVAARIRGTEREGANGVQIVRITGGWYGSAAVVRAG